MIRSLFILLLLASFAAADTVTVTLRSTARVMTSQPITLGDVVTVSDAGLVDLTQVLIDDLERRQSETGWIDLTADEVTDAIALPRARVVVRGRVCRVKVMTPAPAPALTRTTTGRLVEAFDGPILREAIRARICAELGVDSDEIKLNFAAKDAQLIRTSIAEMTVEVNPLGISADFPLAVRIYDGERVVINDTLRVGVLVKKEVLVAKHPVARRSEVSQRDYSIESRWVSPTLILARSEDMTGATARAALKIDDIIESRHVEPPIVVSRGDLVSVRCITGSIIAKINTRALADAREGDRIQFEPITGGRRFNATVNGPGQAVLSLIRQKETNR